MKRVQAWRDLDGSRRKFGLILYVEGFTLHVGRRVYRVCWWFR